MKRNIEITPLSKFPTDALLHEYRRNRICRDQLVKDRLLIADKIWVPHYSIVNGEKIEDYMELLKFPRYSYKKVIEVHYKLDEHYVWNGDYYGFGDHIKINFDGMKWEGDLKELRDELNYREHVNISGKKPYRTWLIIYRKNKKK